MDIGSIDERVGGGHAVLERERVHRRAVRRERGACGLREPSGRGRGPAALLLASLGLYGVLAYYVTRRTHEIGVRMALCADARSVLAHVLARSASMVIPGLALGLVASLAGSRLIERLLYDVTPTDPLSLAAATVSLAVVAFLASAWPAWRAAHIDPVAALRGE